MPTQELELRYELESSLINTIISIRARRRQIEEQWLRSHRAWQSLGYDRRVTTSESSPNDYNIPFARRALERTVVRGVRMLTPNVKWHEVTPMGEVDDETLSNMDQFMWYVLRKKIRSKSNISQLVRCMALYGRCHLKTSIGMSNGQVWPAQRVVDPFSFYVFPETVSVVSEADLVFEDFLFSYEKYKTMSDNKLIDPITPSELTAPTWPYHLIERLANQGLTDPGQDATILRRSVTDKLDATQGSYASLTELWLNKSDKLYQVYILWNHSNAPRIVGFIPSAYDTPLYRSVIHRSLPNETYTNSMMDDIVELSSLDNDILNQYLDAVNWEQGFVGVNDDEISRLDSIKVKGRATWHMKGDPRDAISLFNPPNTSVNQLRAFQVVTGLVNSLAGTGTIAEGQPGRNMPRAGGAVNNLVNLALADVEDMVNLIEQEVMSPSLGDIHKVSSQFIPDEQLMVIPGGKGLTKAVIKKSQILGDFQFEWVGALQNQDDQQRAQRLMIFLNMMPTLEPMLNRQGYTFNAVELLQMIWRFGLGERGLKDVVTPIAELQKEIQANFAAQPGDKPNGQSNGQSNGKPVSGLNYRLQTPTSGFVKRN